MLKVSVRSREKKEKKARKTGAFVAVAFLLAALLGLMVWGTQMAARSLFTDNPLFTLRKLTFHSDGKLRAEHIREYAGIQEGMNLFGVRLTDVRDRLESVPVVNTVELQRRLPNTLNIDITERFPLARIGGGRRGLQLTVDREGHVLGPSAGSDRLPVIEGIAPAGLRPGRQLTDEVVTDALFALEMCDTTRLGDYVKIDTVYVDRGDVLDLRLKDDIRVILPRVQIQAKLRSLAAHLQAARDRGLDVLAMDLRGDRNAVVKTR